MFSGTSGGAIFFLCINDRGGAEISMIRLAQGLHQAGRKVTLVVYGAHPQLGRELGFTGEIVDLKCTKTLTAFLPLCLLLHKRNFDVMISALTHTNIIAIIAARLAARQMRVAVTEHSIDSIDIMRVSPLFNLLVRFAYARAARLVAVSQVLAQHWKTMLPTRATITSLYNPVVEDEEQPIPPPTHAWLEDKKIPVVLGMGRLKPEKNFTMLVEAFAIAATERDLRLVILGEGEERGKIEGLAKKLGVQDKILLPGFTHDKRAWLGHAAMLVCPSKREGFGNVIAEALACGVPVVSNDCEVGPAEILENGRYGRLVPPRDKRAMARAILETLDNPPEKDLLRARARDFTVSRCIDGYAALIDTLAPH